MNITNLSKLALRVDSASELLASAALAFPVTDFVVVAVILVLALVFLGLAEAVVAGFALVALLLPLALGALDVLADSL